MIVAAQRFFSCSVNTSTVTVCENRWSHSCVAGLGTWECPPPQLLALIYARLSMSSAKLHPLYLRKLQGFLSVLPTQSTACLLSTSTALFLCTC